MPQKQQEIGQPNADKADSLGEEQFEVSRQVVGWCPKALDGGYGWVVVLGSFMIHVFADGFVYSFGVIAESLIGEFNATNTEASTILSLLTGLMLATGPLASAICNRIGCRVTTIVGALIASVGCAASYFANSMTFLVLSVGIVMGTGFGLMYCPAMVIVTMYFEKYRALATGVTVCGAGVGTFVFSKLISILIVHFDWRTVFLIYAAVVLLCVPCGALYRPIEFVPIYEGEGEEEEEEHGMTDNAKEMTKEENDGETDGQHQYKADDELSIPADTATTVHPSDHGLVPPSQPLRPARSHQLISKVSMINGISPGIGSAERGGAHGTDDGSGGGLGQRFFSIGDHLHVAGRRGGGVSVSTGYLNFKDVFYSGSITELPEYKEQRFRFRSVSSLSHGSSSAVGGSAIRPSSAAIGGGQPSLIQPPVTVHTDRIEEECDEEMELETELGDGGAAGTERRKRSSEEQQTAGPSTASGRAIEIWRTVNRMLDLSLLTVPVFLLFGFSNFFTSIGFNAPPMFMPMNAEIVLGWDKIDASTTVSAYGLANTLGRIAFGLICDNALPFRWGKDKARNRLWIYNLTLAFCGIISCFVFMLTSFYSFIAYCFLFGFTISSYVCLTTVVLVDMIGIDRLTNGFGLLLFIQGIATFVGPPLAGKLFDLTNRYDWTFAFCGVCLFVSGVMLFVVPWFATNAGASKNRRKENGAVKAKVQQKGEAQELIVRSDSPQHKKYEAV
ncbi:hypothetical protein niasHS_010610 [Heterodera schachtii]|uniref:Major facilitator superfamily (MFS) profile domain-containing protein n=2 Tax=Heterodera TaxID=34509 RepID=A0ABD2J2U5_HETSC